MSNSRSNARTCKAKVRNNAKSNSQSARSNSTNARANSRSK